MKIGVLGTGNVGQTLAKGLHTLGHEVMLSGRDTTNPKAKAWAESCGDRACFGSFEDAARFGDMIVLSTLGAGTENAIRMAGIANLSGKVIIDTTNPLAFQNNMPAGLFLGTTDSLGERVQRLVPRANVVKAFNTVGYAMMINPQFREGRPDMFICGNDPDAKLKVGSICETWKWGVIDLGGIECARYLEPMCLTWVLYAIKTNSFTHAFKLLRS